MLLDVGRNLRVARSPLMAAIRDEERIERKQFRDAYPFAPPTGHSYSFSLKCVVKKIRTGKNDPRLCWYIKQMLQ
jgi:hypothetical protein